MNPVLGTERRKGHNKQNLSTIRNYIVVCLIVFILSSATSVAYAESEITRFLKNQLGSFVEARFQSLYRKRFAEQRVVKSWVANGQWKQQVLTTDRMLLFFDRETETRIEEYDSSGKIKMKTDISYDGDGNIVKKITRDGAGGKIRDEEYAYEDNTIKVIAYDANSDKIEEATYDKNMFLLVRDILVYDSKQQLLGTTHERSMDKVTIKYSIDGQELSRVQLNENNQKLVETFFLYDEKGKLREVDDYNAKGEMIRQAAWTYEYDKHGFCTKETEDIVDGVQKLPSHSQIITIRNVKYLFTLGGLLEGVGEAFIIVVIIISIAFFSIGMLYGFIVVCIKDMRNFWLRKSIRSKGFPALQNEREENAKSAIIAQVEQLIDESAEERLAEAKREKIAREEISKMPIWMLDYPIGEAPDTYEEHLMLQASAGKDSSFEEKVNIVKIKPFDIEKEVEKDPAVIAAKKALDDAVSDLATSEEFKKIPDVANARKALQDAIAGQVGQDEVCYLARTLESVMKKAKIAELTENLESAEKKAKVLATEIYSKPDWILKSEKRSGIEYVHDAEKMAWRPKKN